MATCGTRAYGWLWLVVLVQVAIPASYYLREEAGRDDERFAWRMFSAVRVKRCQVELSDQRDGDWVEVTLPESLHASWQHALARGRERVIARVLESRCGTSGVQAAELVRRCKDAENDPLAPARYRLACDTRRVTRETRR